MINPGTNAGKPLMIAILAIIFVAFGQRKCNNHIDLLGIYEEDTKVTHPDWVEAQKRKGYEIKKIGKGYYMYERKSRWDSNKKRAIKVTGEYIGVVTPEGVIPRKNKVDEIKPVFSLEYGATAFIESIAGDILGNLAKHFDKMIAQKIWVISMLRLVLPCPFRSV